MAHETTVSAAAGASAVRVRPAPSAARSSAPPRDLVTRLADLPCHHTYVRAGGPRGRTRLHRSPLCLDSSELELWIPLVAWSGFCTQQPTVPMPLLLVCAARQIAAASVLCVYCGQHNAYDADIALGA
jgi:hypothetical protein